MGHYRQIKEALKDKTVQSCVVEKRAAAALKCSSPGVNEKQGFFQHSELYGLKILSQLTRAQLNRSKRDRKPKHKLRSCLCLVPGVRKCQKMCHILKG